MSTVITFLLVLSSSCRFGVRLVPTFHAFDIDQKVILIWTDVFEHGKMVPVYALIIAFILPAIGALHHREGRAGHKSVHSLILHL